MVRFEGIAIIEKVYPYKKAKAYAEYANGTFGTVTSGVFTAGAGFEVIMQEEKGDDMNSNRYVVVKDEPVRVADLAKADGEIVNVDVDSLAGTVAKNNKLVANASGKLAVEASPSGNYLLVEEVTRYGCRAKVVVA